MPSVQHMAPHCSLVSCYTREVPCVCPHGTSMAWYNGEVPHASHVAPPLCGLIPCTHGVPHAVHVALPSALTLGVPWGVPCACHMALPSKPTNLAHLEGATCTPCGTLSCPDLVGVVMEWHMSKHVPFHELDTCVPVQHALAHMCHIDTCCAWC